MAPKLAEHKQQSLQGENDATSATVAETEGQGFHPENLPERREEWGTDDAFNKIGGARERRRHRPTSGHCFRLNPLPSLKNATPQKSGETSEMEPRNPTKPDATAAEGPLEPRPPARQKNDDSQGNTVTPLERETTPASAVVVGPA